MIKLTLLIASARCHFGPFEYALEKDYVQATFTMEKCTRWAIKNCISVVPT